MEKANFNDYILELERMASELMDAGLHSCAQDVNRAANRIKASSTLLEMENYYRNEGG
jgi:hypothetical protein